MAADAARAQQVLADYLEVTRAFTSHRVESAFRTVARHQFLPDAPLEYAYADRAVVIKIAPDGTPISSASQPTIVAQMLEMLAVEPGNSILEVGTATGFNAALLDYLIAPGGSVVTVELDDDLAHSAKERLRRLGHGRTRVIVGDGKLGFVDHAPYDRIVVTAGAREPEQTWIDQLVTGGRLVVPLVDHYGVGEVVAFAKVDGALEPREAQRCGFLPLR